MHVAGLPFEFRKALGEVDGVFTRAAGDLEHQPILGQPVGEHFGDGFAVAQDCGRGPPCALRRRLIEAPLVDHSAASTRRALKYSSSLVAESNPSAKPMNAS